MKKIIALVLVLIMALSMTACGGNQQTGQKGDAPVIAFVPKVIGQAWWDYVRDGGVMEWAEENGIEVKYQGPTEVDAVAQVQILTDLIAQDIDILCFSPNDPDACENVVKEAREKGIIVIATEATGMQNIDYDVEAFSEEGLGAFMMDELAAQMGEEGEYITMVGSMTMESHNNWADAAVARQKEVCPNMTLVADERITSDLTLKLPTRRPRSWLKISGY